MRFYEKMYFNNTFYYSISKYIQALPLPIFSNHLTQYKSSTQILTGKEHKFEDKTQT